MESEPYLVSELLLPRHIKRRLFEAGIFSIAQLCAWRPEELRRLKSIDARALNLVRMRLRKLGKSLFDVKRIRREEYFDAIISIYRSGVAVTVLAESFHISSYRISRLLERTFGNKLEAIRHEHMVNSGKDRRDLIQNLKMRFSVLRTLAECSEQSGIPISTLRKYLPEVIGEFKEKQKQEREDRLRFYFDQKKYGGNRLAALEKTDYSCANCGMTKGESQVRFGKDLYVYHVNILNDNSIENLMPLCVTCFFQKVKRVKQKI